VACAEVALAFEEIGVDLRELADFGTLLRGETEQNLRPHAHEIIDTYCRVRPVRPAVRVRRDVRDPPDVCGLPRPIGGEPPQLRPGVGHPHRRGKTICEEYERSDRSGAATMDMQTQVAQAEAALADASGGPTQRASPPPRGQPATRTAAVRSLR
jgi:hypothetical protein